MLKRFKNIILLLIVSSQLAAADSSNFLDLSLKENDPVYIFLAFLFGTVSSDLQCTGAACSGLSSLFFRYLNLGVLSLGSLIMAYTLFMGVAQSAQEGEFLGKKFSSFGTPVKTFFGLGFLTPTSTGYSMLQAMVMQVIIMGSALGNQMYLTVKKYHDTYNTAISTESVTVSASSSQAVDDFLLSMAPFAFKALVCQEFMNSPNYADASGQLIQQDYGKSRVYFGYKDSAGTLNHPYYCGRISFDFGLPGSDQETKLSDNVMPVIQAFNSNVGGLAAGWVATFSQKLSYGAKEIEMQKIKSQFVDSLIQLRQNLINTAIISKAEDNDTTLDEAESWLSFALNLYKWTGDGDRQQISIQDGLGGDLLLFLGATDYPSKEALDVVDFTNLLVDLNPVIEPESLRAKYQSALATFQSASSSSPVSSMGSIQYNTNASSTSAAKNSAFDPLQGLYPLLNDIVQMNEDPIHRLSQYGINLIKIGYAMLLTALSVGMLSIGVTAYFASKFSSFAVGMASALIGFILTFFTVFGFLIPIGTMLGIYLPLIPGMIFSLAAVAWFLQVLESMVAAPIVALGMMAPTQEFVGKAAPSLLLLINIFIRPALMILGGVLGAKLFALFASYITFLIVKIFYMTNPSGLLLLVLVFIFMYSALMISTAQRCFSLIYMIPDKVISWIGGQSMGIAQEINQDLQALQQSAQKGSEQTREDMKGAVKSVQALNKNIVDSILKKNKDNP